MWKNWIKFKINFPSSVVFHVLSSSRGSEVIKFRCDPSRSIQTRFQPLKRISLSFILSPHLSHPTSHVLNHMCVLNRVVQRWHSTGLADTALFPWITRLQTRVWVAWQTFFCLLEQSLLPWNSPFQRFIHCNLDSYRNVLHPNLEVRLFYDFEWEQ